MRSWLREPPAFALFAVFAFGALLIESVTPGLASLDDYRHARYAAELFERGFQVFGHPFLPLTLVGQYRADLWLGFHELLALVLRNDGSLLARAKVLSAVLAAVAPTTLYVVLRRRMVPSAALWAVFAAVCCPAWVYRDLMLRPAPLTIALCLGIYQSASESRWRLPLGLSVVFSWLHVSSPLAVVMAGWGAWAASGKPLRERALPIVASLAGLALGYALRPDAGAFLQLAWVQGTMPFSGAVPHVGNELRPPRFSELMSLEAVPLMLGLAATLPALRNRRWADTALFLVSLVASVFVRRFAEFLLPFAMLLAAPEVSRWRFHRLALALGLLPLSWYTGALVRDAFADGPLTTRPAAEVLAASPGLVVNSNCFDFPLFYFHEPSVPFVCGYDPSFLAAQSPRAFWLWEHLRRDGTFCDVRECAEPASGAGIVRAMEALDARWLAIGNAERDARLLSIIEDGSAPGLVKRYASDAPDGVVLFERVK